MARQLNRNSLVALPSGSRNSSLCSHKNASRRASASVASVSGAYSGSPLQDDGVVERSALSRKLSFVNISVDDIKHAILAEDPEWQFSELLWYNLLMSDPDPSFKIFQNRTLQYWVRVYNAWQEMGEWDSSKVPMLVDGHQLNELTRVHLQVLKPIIKLFDPAGYRRLQVEGASHGIFAKVRVDFCEFMVAGVMLSRVISTVHKLRFVFGVVDLDDNRCLDEKEFGQFITIFINGLACVFGLSENRDVLPSDKAIAVKANRLYSHIGAIAAQRIMELHDSFARAGSHREKAMLVSAVKQRQQAPRGADRRTPGAHRQTLPFQVLNDWCLRVFRDPLALPYALAIERFRSERHGDVADEYDEVLLNFYLSHKQSVPITEDEVEITSSDLLDREDVVAAKKIYDAAADLTDPFSLSPWKMADEFGLKFEAGFSSRLGRALDTASEETCHHHVDFKRFLNLLCPKALPKHINMMVAWCKQHEEKVELDNLVEQAKAFQHLFAANSHKPVIPANELKSIEKQFRMLDRGGKGYVTAEDLINEWEWDEQTVRDTITRFDLKRNGRLDRTEFMRMMTPEDYHFPETNGYERQLFGKVLEAQLAEKQKVLQSREAVTSGEVWSGKMDAPISSRPEVDSSEWDRWNAVFDELDTDKDDIVGPSDIDYAGWLSQELSQFIVTVIDPQLAASFTRHGFLSMLLQTHGCRRKGFISSL